jgi:hypothetical protein
VIRCASLGLALCVLAPAVLRSAEPTRPAVLYSLPADGAWVEFDWTLTGPGPGGKETKGTLRLSSVGSKTVDDTACRWVEARKEFKPDEQTRREFRKLLIAEKEFAAKPTLRDHVRMVIGQEGDASPELFSPGRARDFLNMGLNDPDAALKEVAAREEVSTPLGKYKARHVMARDKSGERTREYHGWLTADVPFGCARFEVREARGDGPLKVVFTATAARSGKDAKPEVDEAKAR